MTKRPTPGKVIGGQPIESEADHFIRCPVCGTLLDCRELGDVLLHEEWHNGGNVGPMPGHSKQYAFLTAEPNAEVSAIHPRPCRSAPY